MDKNREISLKLRRYIDDNQLQAHSAFPSELELAQKFSTTKVTVRKAISALVEEGALYRLQRKGTFVSPSVKRHQVLIVYNTSKFPGLSDYALREFANGMSQGAYNTASSVIPMVIDEPHFLAQLNDLPLIFKNLSLVIFFRCANVLVHCRQTLVDQGIPFAFYGSSSNLSMLGDTSSFTYNEEKIISLGCQYLLDSGHREIIFLVRDDILISQARGAIFKKWIRKNKVKGKLVTAPIINTMIHPAQGRFNAHKAIVRQCRERHIGIFAPNDFMAVGMLNAALFLGCEIPSDFSIIGIDDIAFLSLAPVSLPSVVVPCREDGEKMIAHIPHFHQGPQRFNSDVRLNLASKLELQFLIDRKHLNRPPTQHLK